MEVRPDILKKLLCSVCGEYLSCAPVCMQNDGAMLCGRCASPEGEQTLRITPYEDLAQMMLFPCVNKKHGCTESLYMAEMKDHEEDCAYKQYVCPVTESGQCDWSGARKNIWDHCKETHPDNLLQDPYTIKHNINVNNHKTFLMAAFQMLFIIHCKVCVISKNIYQSVRLIGKSALANQYRYELEVSNNDDSLIRRSDVSPQGCMALQEDMSIHVDFSTMLKFLGDFKDVTFKIKLGRKCVKCKKCAMKSSWPINTGWCCEACAPARLQCKFNSKGCSYTDINWKANKHEVLYCQYGTRCVICKKLIPEPREKHYESIHSDVTYKAGATWRTLVVNEWKYFIITNDVGKLWCKYILRKSYFKLNMWSPLHTEQLSDYRCVVTLTNPGTEHTVRKIMLMKYGTQVDWKLILNEEEFLMYVSDNEFNIKIELTKK